MKLRRSQKSIFVSYMTYAMTCISFVLAGFLPYQAMASWPFQMARQGLQQCGQEKQANDIQCDGEANPAMQAGKQIAEGKGAEAASRQTGVTHHELDKNIANSKEFKQYMDQAKQMCMAQHASCKEACQNARQNTQEDINQCNQMRAAYPLQAQALQCERGQEFLQQIDQLEQQCDEKNNHMMALLIPAMLALLAAMQSDDDSQGMIDDELDDPEKEKEEPTVVCERNDLDCICSQQNDDPRCGACFDKNSGYADMECVCQRDSTHPGCHQTVDIDIKETEFIFKEEEQTGPIDFVGESRKEEPKTTPPSNGSDQSQITVRLGQGSSTAAAALGGPQAGRHMTAADVAAKREAARGDEVATGTSGSRGSSFSYANQFGGGSSDLAAYLPGGSRDPSAASRAQETRGQADGHPEIAPVNSDNWVRVNNVHRQYAPMMEN